MSRTKLIPKLSNQKVTTLLMEVVLMKHFEFQHNYIVPKVSFGAGLHECDLLVITKSGYAHEIEIKIDKQDLINDKHKPHQHVDYRIKEFWFAVPLPLEQEALKHIPDRAGLLSVYERGGKWRCRVSRLPQASKKPYKWNQDEIFNLLRLAAMRIYTLKKLILKINSK